MDEKLRQILLHAQLDLVQLLDFATTVSDQYDKDSVLETLKELRDLTDDQTGSEYLD